MKRNPHNFISTPMVKRLLTVWAFCLTVLSLSLASCIKEDRSNCPYESLLYIVVDTEGWDAVDVVDGATLYLFDDDLTLLSSVYVSGEDIAAEVPIAVSYRAGHLPYAVVWGNLGDRETVSTPAVGDRIDNLLVSMAHGTDNYELDSDKLFYGAKKLQGERTEYITITPKTGRIAITVEGLTPDDTPDAYYFTVEDPYGRYGFTGDPIRSAASLRLPGVFTGSDLITPQPYHLFHFPDPASDTDLLTVNLYDNVSTATPILLASVTHDDDGNPILIYRGRTTNVLITVDPRGSISISVITTGWFQTHDQRIGW